MYEHDINGRLTSKVTPYGTMSFTYYDNGLVKMIRDYNGARITHYYDDFGRLSRITRTTFGENASSTTPVIYTYNKFRQIFCNIIKLRGASSSNKLAPHFIITD